METRPLILIHHHSIPLLLIVTVLLSGASSAAARTDAGDAAAMRAVAKALDPTNVLGWSAYSDPCTKWDGVRCTGNRVTSILVSARGISGVLPSEVCNLVDLQVMTNNLSGPLPSLSGLSSLSTLFLANNSFSSIPTDFFLGLESLTNVYMDNNPLAAWTFPRYLRQASNLQPISSISPAPSRTSSALSSPVSTIWLSPAISSKARSRRASPPRRSGPSSSAASREAACRAASMSSST